MCLVLQHELRYLALEQLKTSDHLTPTGIAAIKKREKSKHSTKDSPQVKKKRVKEDEKEQKE